MYHARGLSHNIAAEPDAKIRTGAK